MQSVSDGQSFRKLRDGLHAGRTLAGAGLLRPHRPDRAIRAARKIARWGQSAAGAYAATELRHFNAASSKAGKHVLELRQFNLQLSFAGAGVFGKNVQD